MMSTLSQRGKDKGKGEAQDDPIEIGSKDTSPESHCGNFSRNNNYNDENDVWTSDGAATQTTSSSFKKLKATVPPDLIRPVQDVSSKDVPNLLLHIHLHALKLATYSKNLAIVTECLKEKQPKDLTMVEVQAILDGSEPMDIQLRHLRADIMTVWRLLRETFSSRFPKTGHTHGESSTAARGDDLGEAGIAEYVADDSNAMETDVDSEAGDRPTIIYRY